MNEKLFFDALRTGLLGPKLLVRLNEGKSPVWEPNTLYAIFG